MRPPLSAGLAAGGVALELEFDDRSCRLDAEFLRVHSPSAEVRRADKPLSGKLGVRIEALERAGNYALRPLFSDGHSSGIYSWDYLRRLDDERHELWQLYLQRLRRSALSRDPEVQLVCVRGLESAPAPAKGSRSAEGYRSAEGSEADDAT